MKKTRWLTSALAALSLPLSAEAEVPNVAVDIPPLHSLVAQVMAGAGEPDLLVRPGASPHGYSLSPSEAGALQDADLVFWMSEALTPWMENSLRNLASNAQTIEMLEVAGTTTHSVRAGATFESHDHGDHGDAEGKGHHEEEGHHAGADHDDGEHHGGGHGHHHEGIDPHAWLDPANARLWLDVIAEALSEQDPDNAALYASNAAEGKEIIDDISENVEATVNEMGHREFIVFHDAYQYFERRFGIEAAGAIAIGDASDPGPARVRELRNLVEELNIQCVFTEPQYNPDLVKTVFGDTGVNTSAVMDPLGASLEPGPGLYPNLLKAIAESLRTCSEVRA